MAGERSILVSSVGPEDFDNFRALCREYAESLPFSLCFQGFDQEMAGLPGKYAAPTGAMLLAKVDGRPAGCAALRPIDALPGDPVPVCEMKRMFVRPEYRGLGLGRLLAEELLSRARNAGYRMMKLDSEPDFTAAMSLYRALGFVDIARYNDDPHPQTVYLGLRL
jgi:putative acetyltransferase